MIFIDLPADLNMEDDQGRNLGRLADAMDQGMIREGVVLVVGTPNAWSWALVEDIEGGFVFFRQISGREAARLASLVVPLPRPA
jgi:hypothetical protein